VSFLLLSVSFILIHYGIKKSGDLGALIVFGAFPFFLGGSFCILWAFRVLE
jgi:hypothetical protein